MRPLVCLSAILAMAAAAAAQEAAQNEPAEESLVSRLKRELKLEAGGSANSIYTFNANDPFDRRNSQRVFDVEEGEFNLNLVDLYLERPVTERGDAGFRLDVGIGEDAAIFQAAGFDDSDNIEIQQALVQWIAPVGSGLRLTIGKFVSMHGAEVIESADNMNSSRSWLYGFAVPFTHTGALASYTPTEGVTLTAGVVNGWDNVDDNNDAKSVQWAVKWEPDPQVSAILSGMNGPEQAGNTSNRRWLADLVVTWKPREDLTFALNVDVAAEENAAVGGGDASWSGAALYGRYQFDAVWSLAARVEQFRDADGARLGVDDQRLTGLTLTAACKPEPSLEFRLEGRLDRSSKDVFTTDDPADPTDRMPTLSLEAIVRF